MCYYRGQNSPRLPVIHFQEMSPTYLLLFADHAAANVRGPMPPHLPRLHQVGAALLHSPRLRRRSAPLAHPVPMPSHPDPPLPLRRPHLALRCAPAPTLTRLSRYPSHALRSSSRPASQGGQSWSFRTLSKKMLIAGEGAHACGGVGGGGEQRSSSSRLPR
jgi:hypothetical protein